MSTDKPVDLSETPLGESPFPTIGVPAALSDDQQAQASQIRDVVRQVLAEVNPPGETGGQTAEGKFTTQNSKELVSLVGYIGASQLGTGLLKSAGLTWEAVLPMVLVALKAWNLWRSKE